jgi:hypothetical protein
VAVVVGLLPLRGGVVGEGRAKEAGGPAHEEMAEDGICVRTNGDGRESQR